MEIAQNTNERTLTLKWQDPAQIRPNIAALSGLEYLQELQSGTIPTYPINVLMGIAVIEVEAGRVRLSIAPDERHTNPMGMAQGGMAATVLDTAIGHALLSELPAGVGCTTVEMNVHYIRPILPGKGEFYCEGRVVYKGKQLATVESKLTDATGKLYAQASATCAIIAG